MKIQLLAGLVICSMVLCGCKHTRIDTQTNTQQNNKGVESELKTVWDLPDTVDMQLIPGEGSSALLTDGDVMVVLSAAKDVVSEPRKISLHLIKEDSGYRITFEPALALQQPIRLTAFSRNGGAGLVPLALSGDQYSQISYGSGNGVTSMNLSGAGSVWMGSSAQAGSVSKGKLVKPEGIDCDTVVSIDNFESLLTPEGDKEAAARYAALELNRLLNSPAPPEACSNYFSSILQLGRVVRDLGMYDVKVDPEHFRTRVSELLEQCSLDYEFTWEVNGVLVDGNMKFASQKPMSGDLTIHHHSPLVQGGFFVSEGQTTGMSMTLDATVEPEFDLSRDFEARVIYNIPTTRGKARISGEKGGESFAVDLDIDGDDFSFVLSDPAHGAIMTGDSRVDGTHQTGKIVIANMGEFHVYGELDKSNSSEISLELMHKSRATITSQYEDSVVTTSVELLIPSFADVDMLTKIVCEFLAPDST